MTIALGILAKDGVVIAADTEETLDVIKYSGNKVRGAAHFAVGRPGRFLLVAGAGAAHYIDAFSETLEALVHDKSPRFDTEPHVVIDEALEQFYMRKVVPLAGYPVGERPDFRVIIGLVAGGKSHLFVSDGATLRRENRFAAIGAGELVARPLINSYIGHSSARSMSVREAAIVAALSAHEAKAVTGVGGDTDVLAMWDNGSMSRIVPPDYAPLEQVLKQVTETLRPSVVRAVIGRKDPTEISAEIERIRTNITQVIGNRFDDPGSRVPTAPPTRQSTSARPKLSRKSRSTSRK